MPIESLARGMRAVRGRVLKCFKEVGGIDSRRKGKAEGELSMAKLHLARRDFAGARKHISNALANAWENGLAWNCEDGTGTVPLHARAWELMAKSYFDQGKQEEGEACVEAAGFSAAEVSLLNKGIWKLRAGDFKGAAREFTSAENAGLRYSARASKLLGRRLKGAGSAAVLSLGYARMLAGDFKGGLLRFNEALICDASNFEAWAAKASALDALGRDVEAAVWYAKVRKETEKS